MIKEYKYDSNRDILNNIFSNINYLQYENSVWNIKSKPNVSINPTISINSINYILDNSSYEVNITDSSNIVIIDISTNNFTLNSGTNITLDYYIQFSNRLSNNKMIVGKNFYHKDIFSNNNIMSFYINTVYPYTVVGSSTTEINQTIDSFKIKFS